MLPPFRPNGTLPPGIHVVDWSELVRRFGGTGRRQVLLTGLRRALDSLREAGCGLVYIDGSFVTEKSEPNDFDACWDLKRVDPERLDPVLLDFSRGRISQKVKFLGELFPAELPAGLDGKTFLELFQRDKESGHRKGIVAIHLSGETHDKE